MSGYAPPAEYSIDRDDDRLGCVRWEKASLIADRCVLVPAAIGLGPGGEPLPEPCAALRFVAREIVLLRRIADEVVEFLRPVAKIDRILPTIFTHAEREAVLCHIEVRA